MRGYAFVARIATILAWLVLLVVIAACGAGKSLSLEERIREYLYKYQPTTGQQFVDWASKELSDYSSQQVFRALRAEGQFQARLGHPNVVGVLSFAAQAWAEHKGLRYDVGEWLALQEEARKNMRTEPGDLQLWPTTPK